MEIGKLYEEFGAEIEDEQMEELDDLLRGGVVGRRVSHVWAEEGGERVIYNGRITEFKTVRRKDKYLITYWLPEEDEEDGVEYDMTVFELGADLIAGDLLLSGIVL